MVEGWLMARKFGKRQHGHRCSPQSPPADMHPWADQDPGLPPDRPPPPVPHDHGPTGGDTDDSTGSTRYSAGPGAGDFGGDGIQVVRARFSRSSSSLEQIPEEIGVGSYEDSAHTLPGTCSIRRARYRISHCSTTVTKYACIDHAPRPLMAYYCITPSFTVIRGH